MFDSLLGAGKLEKMIICAFNPETKPGVKPTLSESEEDKYKVLVNPDSYTINYKVNYDQRPAHGNSGSKAKYASSSPPSLEFTFLFDGTGIIPPAGGPLDGVPIAGAIAGAIGGLLGGNEEYDVMKELQKFSNVVYKFNGKEHRPRRVQLNWGKLVFDAVLNSLSINYKLFKPDGTPLRAEAKASFSGTIADMLRESKEKKNSPDLTHVRTVLAGDKLPLMTNRIYGLPAYYIEVARTNKLFNFRSLSNGANIYFPPTNKTQ